MVFAFYSTSRALPKPLTLFVLRTSLRRQVNIAYLTRLEGYCKMYVELIFFFVQENWVDPLPVPIVIVACRVVRVC